MCALSNSNLSSSSLTLRARYPGLVNRAANATNVSTTPVTNDTSAVARPAQLGLNLEGLKQLLQRMTNPGSTPVTETKTSEIKNGTYTVRNGDTLWQIASRNLGSGMRWEEIYNLNKDKISNPDRIFPGLTLKMPDPTKPAETTKATEPTTATVPTKPAEPTKPTEATKPADPTKPTEATKPAEPTKPAETSKPAEASKPAEPNGSGPLLKKGADGDAVKKLQARLTELGFDCGGVDGDFGNNTANAVKKFQASKGLEVDGVVGPNTWKQLGITVDGGSSAPASSAPAKSSEPNGSGPVLKNGANGEAVKKLQARLNELGFNCGGVDGDFGPNTANAVKSFQSSKGLEVDGVVGPNTWKQLGITVEGGVSYSSSTSSSSSSGGSGPTLKSGAQGDPVKKLQARLNELGFDCGGVDGDFGNNTASAVKRFQASRGLEADGVVGPNTWNKLGINVSGSVSYASGVSGASSASSSAIVQGAYRLHNSGYRYPVNLTDQYRHVTGKIGCCADFVCDSYREAGSNINADMTSKGYNPHYCPSMINYFKKCQQYISGEMGARPGDVVFFNWDGGVVDHVAIVAEVDSKGRPTKLVESRHFDSPTEITTLNSSRAACIVGYGRLG